MLTYNETRYSQFQVKASAGTAFGSYYIQAPARPYQTYNVSVKARTEYPGWSSAKQKSIQTREWSELTMHLFILDFQLTN